MSVSLTVQTHGVWQFDAWGGNGCLLFSLENDTCNDWCVWNYGGLENYPYTWLLPIFDSSLESTRVYWRNRLFKASDAAARDQRQWREIAQ